MIDISTGPSVLSCLMFIIRFSKLLNSYRERDTDTVTVGGNNKWQRDDVITPV